jgi:hypothetical protein
MWGRASDRLRSHQELGINSQDEPDAMPANKDWEIAYQLAVRVESRGSIKTRPSLLDPDVQLSLHPAPDILSLRFCSCVDNRGRIHVSLQDFSGSNSYDFRLHGVDVLSLLLQILIRRIHMNGFAV